jgi:hypothetical protein
MYVTDPISLNGSLFRFSAWEADVIQHAPTGPQKRGIKEMNEQK